MIIAYKKGTTFKSVLHDDTYFSVISIPTCHIRKDKKVIVDNDNYTLDRIPDRIEYISKYDGTKCVFYMRNITITEEHIKRNIKSGNWIEVFKK